MSSKIEYHLSIKDMPPDQRPRERLINFGVVTLSNAEILAIILGSGAKNQTSLDLAQRLLGLNGGLRYLAEATVDQLSNLRGIGPAKAAQIKAAVELGKRLRVASQLERPVIKSPLDVGNLLSEEMRYLDREQFKALLLNTKNCLLSIDTISIGSLNASLVHPRELFKNAVIKSAAGLILVHNHPSGNPEPSSEDINMTKRIIEAGDILGISVLDHIIIGDGTHISLREKGLI